MLESTCVIPINPGFSACRVAAQDHRATEVTSLGSAVGTLAIAVGVTRHEAMRPVSSVAATLSYWRGKNRSCEVAMTFQSQAPQQDVQVLDVGTMEIVLGIVAGTVLIGGLVVTLSRGRAGRSDGNMSTIRSWLAVALVSGLILFCAISLAIPDSSMRSTLFGGLIASAGAATAFYFASSNSDQARKDILDASFGTMDVPDLANMTLGQVHEVVARSAMELQVQPSDAPGTATVRTQSPPPGMRVRRGTTLTVTADVPPPAQDGR